MTIPIRYQLELFFTALGFFTRIPVPAWVPWSSERLQESGRYLPLVGWVVAAVGAAAFAVSAAVLPVSLAVLLSMAATVRLTGAFHEDGWADTCDGLGGGWAHEQILAIMKDSHVGSYALIGTVLMLLTKATALIELANLGTPSFIVALCVAHPLSRLAATSLMHRLDYVREDDLSKSRPLARRLPREGLLAATLFGLLPLLLLDGPAVLGAVVATLLVTWWASRLLVRRLGGYTGDCLGAVQQITELACYLGLLAAWNSI